MTGKKNAAALSPEERIKQALVADWEQPYKVPANWCWTTLQNIARWGSGGTPSRKISDYYIGTIPWIKTGELDDNYIYETEEHISEKAIENSSAKLFPINTVIIAMYGATIGKVGIMGIEATTNQACACGVCSSAIYHKYLFYYAISQKDEFIKKGKGGAQPNISQEVIKQHKIPLPPLAEQQRIVDRIEELFTDLDKAKDKAQAVLDSADSRKTAILNQAFNGELTEQWRNENGVSLDSWENQSLSNFITLLSGQDFPPQKYLSEPMGIPYITGASNFNSDGVIINRWTTCGTVISQKNDVLLVCKGSCGKTIIADYKEAHIARQIMALRVKDNLNNRFLLYYLQSKLDYLRNGGRGLIPGISRNVVLDMPLTLPTIEEQAEIVRILDDLLTKEQRICEAAEEMLEKIELMKKAVLADAFRGRLGTNDPADESAEMLLKEMLK